MSRLLMGVCLLLVGSGAVEAKDYKVGDRVVVIQEMFLKKETKTIDKVFPGLVLQVEKVKGNRLWLSRGKPGWLDKKYVIPFDSKATDYFTNKIKANPTNTDWRYARAILRMQKGELQTAIIDYTELIRLDPKQPAYYVARGIAWDDKKEYNKAIADYNNAIRLDPKNALTYNNRGNAWQYKKEYDKAISDYNTAIRLDPKDAFTYINRGDTWDTKKEYGKAIADYNIAIRLDPNNAHFYNSRGASWVNKKEYNKAIADYNTAIRIDPKDTKAYINRGITWCNKKEYDKAIADYNIAIRLDPKFAYAYGGRGNAWYSKKEYDKAIADFNTTIRLDPKDGYPCFNKALILAAHPDAAKRDGKQAVALATKGCKLASNWEEKYYFLGALAAAYAEVGDFVNAVKWQEKAIALIKNDAEKMKKHKARLELYKAKKPFRLEAKK